MAGNPRKDEISGVDTTGHEWDGIEELNNPLPRWWLWVLYASVIWSIGYWIAMPAWPGISDYTRGMLGYSQRQTVMDELAEVKAGRADIEAKIVASSLEDIAKNPNLNQYALAAGQAAFGDNCAACHGSGAQGAKGYPNLNDDHWLWGGSLEDIHYTINYGIRSTHDETRFNDMTAFLADEILEKQEISDVAEYVLSLSGTSSDSEAAQRGLPLFEDNCVACHETGGVGNREMGAPNLSDKLWLFGGDKKTVVQSISYGRKGVMPTWEARLDPVTIKALSIYVHSLGGGE
ncbi:cytochrome Cbb3 [Kiloniella spongiae]|uniref:Cbb3-type cytochrome c oxidase subunit n=1 Tax=Kiloniella spongiae TaxID=1489064 RepID=A0A0H2MRR2_9PROT|nr:cytochrome-c oxidase, cbb3-type subunit III [Kiloniella spongiae]KLN59380.1 cytochrome Cbb3 [Kiloniella spongiae]